MTEPEAERIAREDKTTEQEGLKWQRRSDEFLVGYVSHDRPGQFHTPAIVEMQRRVMASYERASVEASRQTGVVIRLTKQLAWLTVAIVVLTLVQVAIALWNR